MNYEIISTGSRGNCVLINDVMVDCGVPYTKIKEHLYNVKYLLITHVHGDHLKKSTYNYIRKHFPHITVIGNYDVAQMVDIDYLINTVHPLEFDEYTFNAFECIHDVPCYGFYWEFDDLDILYATDTSNMNFAPVGKKFDYIFLESNHDEKKLEAVKNRTKDLGYDAYAGGLRHLSTQKSREYFFVNRKNRDAVHVELHMSERFY